MVLAQTIGIRVQVHGYTALGQLCCLRSFSRSAGPVARLSELHATERRAPICRAKVAATRLDRGEGEWEDQGPADLPQENSVPIDLAELLEPRSCAVVTHELQESVVGEGAPLVALVAEAEPTFAAVRRLLTGARAAGGAGGPPHGRCLRGPDSPPNSPLASALARRGAGKSPNSDHQAARVISAIGPQASDHVVERHHGCRPFRGPTRRSLRSGVLDRSLRDPRGLFPTLRPTEEDPRLDQTPCLRREACCPPVWRSLCGTCWVGVEKAERGRSGSRR